MEKKYSEYIKVDDKSWNELIDDLLKERLEGNLVHANVFGYDLYSDTITKESAYMQLVDMTPFEYEYYTSKRDEIINPLISQCYIDVIKDENFKSYVQKILFNRYPGNLQVYDLFVRITYGLGKSKDGFYGVKDIHVERVKQFAPYRKSEALDFIDNYIKDEYKAQLFDLLGIKSVQK